MKIELQETRPGTGPGDTFFLSCTCFSGEHAPSYLTEWCRHDFHWWFGTYENVGTAAVLKTPGIAYAR